jgi:DNA-binding CsgD family transcriptional regulator
MSARGRYTVGDAAVELAVRARESGAASSFRHAVLAVCGRLLPCDTAVFSGEGWPDGPVTAGVGDRELALIRHCEEQARRYLPDWRKGVEAAVREGGFVDHEIFSAQERRELPLYCDVIRPQGVRSTVLLRASDQGRTLGMVRLERHSGPPFGRRDLQRGRALLPTIELALMALGTAAPARAPLALPRLTEREAEVAHHVARGLTTPHIALILGTSPLTVRNQICRVFDKARVSSRAELAAWVARTLTRGN